MTAEDPAPTEGTAPTLARLRERQDEIVLALTTESRTARLEELSHELEDVLRQIQDVDQTG
ncbi:hypothetical protein [uncultured Arthrobacter sp.]|uniref:hypothetical protein n=1 Tax=uncultured Arthrobacter sp. TaxID=114050 RepID=UPI00263912FE|nr:hypothetical protein [uncultured Arthrobacter sp.]